MAESDIASVIETPFDAALSERYLVYALSTITARSLPDVRDGLKPVPVKVTTLPAATVDGDAVNVGVVWACAMPPMRKREENTAAVTAARHQGIFCRVTPT